MPPVSAAPKRKSSALAEECLTVHVTDRFGSYGLTGVDALSRASRPRWSWIRSCSVAAHWAAVWSIVWWRASARSPWNVASKAVEIPFVTGQRNRPAQLFLESLGDAPEDGVFRVRAECAPDLLPRDFARRQRIRVPSKLTRACGASVPAQAHRLCADRHGPSHDPSQIFAALRATTRRARHGTARDRPAAHRPRTRPGGALGRTAQCRYRRHSRQLLRTGRPLPARSAIALARAPDLWSRALAGGGLLW